MIVGNHDTLIVLFLRGGMDGLSFVMPTGGPDRALYEDGAPGVLKVPAERRQRGARPRDDGRQPVRAAPGATGLHDLFQDGKVAFVHAAGLDTSSRSHFDNQAQIELGTPGDGGTTDGWLTRHFLTCPACRADTPMVQRIAVSSTIQSAWLADTRTWSPSPTATTFSSTPARRPGATRRSRRCATSSSLHTTSTRATPRA